MILRLLNAWMAEYCECKWFGKNSESCTQSQTLSQAYEHPNSQCCWRYILLCRVGWDILCSVFCRVFNIGALCLCFELVKLFCWQSRHGSSLVCSVSLYLSWHWMTAAMTNVATKIFNGDKNRVKRKKRHKIFKKKQNWQGSHFWKTEIHTKMNCLQN